MDFECQLYILGEKTWTSAQEPEFWTKWFHLCDLIEKQVCEGRHVLDKTGKKSPGQSMPLLSTLYEHCQCCMKYQKISPKLLLVTQRYLRPQPMEF